MDDLIARQIRDKQPEEVTELVLDNARSSELNGLEKFKSLQRLSMVNAGLVSLKGFPSFPNLLELQLGDNKLSGSLDALCGCPKLTQLGLAGNKIAEVADLKPLASLTELCSLDLFNCPVTTIDEYRTQLFEMLLALKSLDGLNDKGEEVESEGEGEEEGEEEGEDDDDEPGLDYLLNNDLRSDSEESDYDPDNATASGDDDWDYEPDDGSGEEDANRAGPSSSKRPRLEKPPPPPHDNSDSSDSD